MLFLYNIFWIFAQFTPNQIKFQNTKVNHFQKGEQKWFEIEEEEEKKL